MKLKKLRIFTDGACSGNPGPGGWAVLFALPKTREVISGREVETTNNRMELMAVVKALGYAIMDGWDIPRCIADDYEEIEVHSDSAYVVNAISKHWVEKWCANGWVTSAGEEVKNVELWKELTERLKDLECCGWKVKFIKVKGHSGVTLNELVDERARQESQKAKSELESRCSNGSVL